MEQEIIERPSFAFVRPDDEALEKCVWNPSAGGWHKVVAFVREIRFTSRLYARKYRVFQCMSKLRVRT